jgi:O-antigen ligase
MGAALILSFSRGALLLGVPAALAVIVIGWQGRRGAVVVGVCALLAVIALPFLAQLPRLAGVFDFQSGTGFFRVNLWLSAWRMFLDHPLLGVGPDNFLYAYRSFYILPSAWQEPNLSHPHNIGMDFLSRLGMLGFACGVWLMVGFWRAAFRAPTRSGETAALRIGLMALVADMLAHGLVDHSFFLVDLAFAFMLAAALIQRRDLDGSGAV